MKQRKNGRLSDFKGEIVQLAVKKLISMLKGVILWLIRANKETIKLEEDKNVIIDVIFKVEYFCSSQNVE